MRLFNFSRSNRLSICPLVDERGNECGRWLSGRIAGKYISFVLSYGKDGMGHWHVSIGNVSATLLS